LSLREKEVFWIKGANEMLALWLKLLVVFSLPTSICIRDYLLKLTFIFLNKSY